MSGSSRRPLDKEDREAAREGLRTSRLVTLGDGPEREAIMHAIFDSMDVTDQIAWLAENGPLPGWKPREK